MAERALREGKVTEAQRHLAQSPAPYRSWEWRYLKRLCSTGAQEIQFSGSSFWDIIPHRSAVNDVAFSPQGKLIATAGDDGNLRVFDFARGVTELEQKVSDEPLRAVAFGVRGRLMAAAGTGHNVHIWDLISRETPVTLPSGKAGTSALAFSKSGLAAGGNDGLVRFWTLPSRKQTVFRGHQRKVKCLFFVHLPATPRFRTGANLLGSVGEDGRLILWRPDGQPAAVFDSPDIDYAVAGFGSGGGLYVATKPDGRISHWRIGLRDNYVPAKVNEPVRVTTRDEKGTVRESVRFEATIRPFYAGTAIQVLPGEPIKIPTLGGRFAVTPDRNSLAVCSGFTVTIWDGHSAERRNRFDDYQDVVTGIAWSPDGRRLATASRDGLVKIRDLTPTSRGHVGPVYSVAFSPANDRFASAGADRTVKLWVGPKGPLVGSLKHDAAVLSLDFAPDGQHLATGSKDGLVQLWDVSSDRVKSVSKTRSHSGEVRCVAFHPNGQQLASAGRDGTIHAHSLDGSEPVVLVRHSAPVNSFAFSPDGGAIAFGSADHKVTLWDSDSGESRTLQGHTAEVVCVAFSPSGRRLASAGLDGTIRVWDPLAEVELVRIATKDVSSISFSADGKRLFASTLQENVKIVDAETGQVLLTLAAQSPLQCLAVSGTEELLAVGGQNGEIRAGRRSRQTRPGIDRE